MASDQSQGKPKKIYHSNLRRTALRLASQVNLSRIELQVLQNLIEWISFRDGNTDPRQEIDKPLVRYMEDLGIPDKAQVSHAFSRLENLGLVINRRVGNVVHRSLSATFIAEISQPGIVQPHNRQTAGCVSAQPSIVSSHNRQLCADTTLSLDRKKDGRIDGIKDGGEEPPSLGGGKISRTAKDYATMFQDCFPPRMRYLRKDEFKKYNDYIQALLDKHGEHEVGELIVFAATEISKLDPYDRKKLSLPYLQYWVVEWKYSTAREVWLQSRKEIKVMAMDSTGAESSQNLN